MGFEPTIPIYRDTAFRERGLQPLGNLSGIPPKRYTINLQLETIRFCAVVELCGKGLITLLARSVNMRGAAHLGLAQGFSF